MAKIRKVRDIKPRIREVASISESKKFSSTQANKTVRSLEKNIVKNAPKKVVSSADLTHILLGQDEESIESSHEENQSPSAREEIKESPSPSIQYGVQPISTKHDIYKPASQQQSIEAGNSFEQSDLSSRGSSRSDSRSMVLSSRDDGISTELKHSATIRDNYEHSSQYTAGSTAQSTMHDLTPERKKRTDLM